MCATVEGIAPRMATFEYQVGKKPFSNPRSNALSVKLDFATGRFALN
jgi:hypothetical protein